MEEQKAAFQGFAAQTFEKAEGIDQILRVPPDVIKPFQNHTFQVRDDEGMQKLMESIKTHGILEPALAFYNEEGELELISGHRRQRVALKLEMETMPVLVRNVNRDEATILMGEANLMQREKILPSEKGFTYKTMLEAIQRLPRNQDEPEEYAGERSRSILAARIGEGCTQIQRYIRLTDLIEDILNLVDAGKFGIRQGVELSFLSRELQQEVFRIYLNQNIAPSHDQAKRMHNLHKEQMLTPEKLRQILLEDRLGDRKDKLTFTSQILIRMLSPYDSIKEREERIIRALRLLKEQENKGKEEMHTQQEPVKTQEPANPVEPEIRSDQDHPSEEESREEVQTDPVPQESPEEMAGYPQDSGQNNYPMPENSGYIGAPGGNVQEQVLQPLQYQRPLYQNAYSGAGYQNPDIQQENEGRMEDDYEDNYEWR